jgi:hypothetical protein
LTESKSDVIILKKGGDKMGWEDSLYLELDPKIRNLVRALNGKGIRTDGSCEGHLDPDKSPHPYVSIPLDSRNIAHWRALFWLFQKLGEWNSQGHEWVLRPFYFDPAYPSWLFLEPREENNDRDPSVLVRLQKEAEDLAEFLSF